MAIAGHNQTHRMSHMTYGPGQLVGIMSNVTPSRSGRLNTILWEISCKWGGGQKRRFNYVCLQPGPGHFRKLVQLYGT